MKYAEEILRLHNIKIMGRKRKGRFAETLVILMLAGSIWQYHHSGAVTWVTDTFRWVESKAKEFTHDLPGLAQKPAPTTTYDLSGKVIKVTDGDTITIRDSSRQKYKIRLHGIDTPESNQTYGRTATKAMSKLVAGKQVQITVKDTDRYGRTVGIVYIDGTNVNLKMVCAGHAWWYQRYAKRNTDLRDCERKAREDKLGLWGGPEPIPPWEYRRR